MNSIDLFSETSMSLHFPVSNTNSTLDIKESMFLLSSDCFYGQKPALVSYSTLSQEKVSCEALSDLFKEGNILKK